MKKSILCIFVAALAICASARTVTRSEARKAAAAWAGRNAAFGAQAADVGTARAFVDGNDVTLWYQVQMGTSCLIVSPVTELEPVIAVLENVDVDTGLPEGHPMRAMLVRDMTARLQKLGLYKPSASGGVSLMGAAPAATVKTGDPVLDAWAEEGNAKWAKLLPSGIRLMEAVTNGVDDATMETYTVVRVVDGFEQGGRFTHWNQSRDDLGQLCYNYYTPSNYPCGCVATAMAAMMQFFNVDGTKAGLSGPHGACKVDDVVAPEYVTLSGGTLSTPLGDISADEFGYEIYNWSLVDTMTTRADYSDPTKMTEEVSSNLLGRVAYDAGVMLSMNWGKLGSGTQTEYIADALKSFVKILDLESKTFVAMTASAVKNPSQGSYAKLIYNQCRAGAPVALGILQNGSTDGHAVLAVGYGRDDEGNERVRIFTGWGGTGDGWYALPYIDTKSLPQDPGNYLFDLVTTVVTMVGYENEGTVPVVGRFVGADVANKTLQLQLRLNGGKQVLTNMTTDANGYFGIRIKPIADFYWLECPETGDEMMFSVSTTPSVDTPASLPPAIQFPYFCDVAAAGQVARESGKPLFCLSGTEGGNADNVATNVDSRFVRTWISDAGSAEFDGDPSFGVFNPAGFEAGGRWTWNNGRLSYGYGASIVLRYTTNDYDEDSTDDDAFATYEYVTNEAYYATVGSTVLGTFQTNSFPYTAEGMLDALSMVLDGGQTEYERQTHGISLTVTAVPAAGAPDPSYGVHVGIYTNGETVTATAPDSLVTNDNVILGFGGWTLVNETTGAATNDTGTTATFTVASNDVLTLTWLTVPNQVWIEIEDCDDLGVTAPGSGWYPYGESVTFTATPNDDVEGFSQWVNATGGALPFYLENSRTSSNLTFTAIEPLSLQACYGGTSPNSSGGSSSGGGSGGGGSGGGDAPRALVPADVPVGTGGADSSPISITPNADGSLKLTVAVGNAVAGYWYVVVAATDVNGSYVNYVPLAYRKAESDGVLDPFELTVNPDPSFPTRFFKVRILDAEPTTP